MGRPILRENPSPTLEYLSTSELVNERWEPAVPEPFYFGLLPWLWRRLTGWRDAHGRKAQLLKPWEF